MTKRSKGITGNANIAIVLEQYRTQMSQTFLYVQGAELNGKIAKYRYRMKKMKVFGGYKLNKHLEMDYDDYDYCPKCGQAILREKSEV